MVKMPGFIGFGKGTQFPVVSPPKWCPLREVFPKQAAAKKKETKGE